MLRSLREKLKLENRLYYFMECTRYWKRGNEISDDITDCRLEGHEFQNIILIFEDHKIVLNFN